jgi:adenylyl-sulfate kinase
MSNNPHAGFVIWLTGLSGSGKSTLAAELERELLLVGLRPYMLDGDVLRIGLNSDLGFSAADRRENIRRAGCVAELFSSAGMLCIAAFISPFREDRETVRRLITDGKFIEVYVNAPLSVCETRDPKGLYVKARANQIPEFTGITSPYEPPLKPEIEIHTDQLSIADSVALILDYLRKQGMKIPKM